MHCKWCTAGVLLQLHLCFWWPLINIVFLMAWSPCRWLTGEGSDMPRAPWSSFRSQSSWCHFACSCSCYLVTLGPHLNPRVISWKLVLNKAEQITLLWVCCIKVHIALFFGDSEGDFVVCESQCDTYVLRKQSSVRQVYLQCMSTNYTSQWWDVQCAYLWAYHFTNLHAMHICVCSTQELWNLFWGARATSTTAVHVSQYACASAWAGTSKANMTCPVPIHNRK